VGVGEKFAQGKKIEKEKFVQGKEFKKHIRARAKKIHTPRGNEKKSCKTKMF